MEARLDSMMSTSSTKWFYIKGEKNQHGMDIYVTRDTEGRTICLSCDDPETTQKSRTCEHCKAVQSLS